MALNGICPYFTMFPLDFPLDILRRHASAGDWVLDPFCGRGTTNYAGRVLGLPSIGIDSSPVAVALSQAKLANATPGAIIRAAVRILDEVPEPGELPEGEFWEWAYHPEALAVLCRLRDGLLRDCRSDARKALRAIILGGLHGPRPKTRQSYFSNQSPRTYAPKPRYAVNYWRSRDLRPESVDVSALIARRASWYYGGEATRAQGRIVRGDSRDDRTMRRAADGKVCWVITSPPYYGLRTYLPGPVAPALVPRRATDGRLFRARAAQACVARVLRRPARAGLAQRRGGVRPRRPARHPLRGDQRSEGRAARAAPSLAGGFGLARGPCRVCRLRRARSPPGPALRPNERVAAPGTRSLGDVARIADGHRGCGPRHVVRGGA